MLGMFHYSNLFPTSWGEQVIYLFLISIIPITLSIISFINYLISFLCCIVIPSIWFLWHNLTLILAWDVKHFSFSKRCHYKDCIALTLKWRNLESLNICSACWAISIVSGQDLVLLVRYGVLGFVLFFKLGTLCSHVIKHFVQQRVVAIDPRGAETVHYKLFLCRPLDQLFLMYVLL